DLSRVEVGAGPDVIEAAPEILRPLQNVVSIERRRRRAIVQIPPLAPLVGALVEGIEHRATALDQKPHQEEREIVARAQVEYVAPGEDDDGLIRRPDISWQEQVSDDPFSSVSSGEADSFFSPAIGGVVDRLDDRLQVGLVIRIKAFECLEEVVRNRRLFSMIPLLDVDGIRRLRGNPFIPGQAKTVVRGSIEG